MAILRLVALLLAAFLLCGCLPVVSTTPLGTTAGLGADAALYGTWKGHSPDNATAKDAFLHIMAASDGSMTAGLVIAEGGSDDGWTIFRLRAATLGQNHLLNAVMTYDKDAPVSGKLKEANIPLLAVRRGDALTLYLLDEEKVKAAIKTGTLKGTVAPGDSSDAVITAEAAALDAFFARPEATALFKPVLVLKKVE